MNKQELIKKYEEKHETVFGFLVIQLNQILEDLKQLDELQEVKVPQFVADWFEKHKSDLDYELWNYIRGWEDQEESEFKNWFNHSKKAFQTLVNMHQFGYEVEKEKRYLVKVKGVSGEARYLNREVDGDWYINNKQETHHFKVLHTRKELEQAGFSWVFDCPGVEVEEVE